MKKIELGAIGSRGKLHAFSSSQIQEEVDKILGNFFDWLQLVVFVGLRVFFWHQTCEYHFVRISIGCLSLTPTCLFERTKLGLSCSIVHNRLEV